jgi:hypothetical protein
MHMQWHTLIVQYPQCPARPYAKIYDSMAVDAIAAAFAVLADEITTFDHDTRVTWRRADRTRAVWDGIWLDIPGKGAHHD